MTRYFGNYKKALKQKKIEDFKRLWIYKYFLHPIVFIIAVIFGIIFAGIVLLIEGIVNLTGGQVEKHKANRKARKERIQSSY